MPSIFGKTQRPQTDYCSGNQKEISDAQALTKMEVVGESWPDSAKVEKRRVMMMSVHPLTGSQTEELTDDNLRGDALASEMLANTTSSSELPSSIRQRTNALAVSSDAPAVLRSRHFSFDKLIVETLAVQDAVFEAEKGILSRRQDKKVVEGDYIPQPMLKFLVNTISGITTGILIPSMNMTSL